MRYWAYGLSGTVLEEKIGKFTKFLDPWTSLLPEFLRKKLNPDVLAVFSLNSSLLKKKDKPIRKKLPYWVLVFPKRSYVPPDYPHFQLWFLDKHFAPSISFVEGKQQDLMTKIIKEIRSTFDCFVKENRQYENFPLAMAINATPFSFIKDEEGKFYGGGQSVRTFHFHFFLLPSGLKKVKVNEEKAPLVYPTSFSKELFRLILGSSKIHKMIFAGAKEKIKYTERGVAFDWKGEIDSLVPILVKIDRIFYQLQLALIFSFYEDSNNFLETLADFMTAERLDEVKDLKSNLILLGHERSLEEARLLLSKEILRFGESYQIKFAKNRIKKLCLLLTLDEKGDLASFVGRNVVTLRPGMGYGTLIFADKAGFRVNIVPLDSLQPEGVMESSGFIFTEKVKIFRKPAWLGKFLDCFERSI